MDYCVDCKKRKTCTNYKWSSSQIACGGFIKNTEKEEKKYKDFVDIESHNRETGGVDEDTGLRYEYWDIGMVRNAKEKDKKRMKVFLDPSPHVILDQNIPLRGWYKSKVEPKGTRNRPCFTEALLTQPYGGSCPGRCLFCYVNNGLRGYRGQGITVVDPKYSEKIEKQLDKMKFGWNAYISSFIEPFNPLEKIYHNTEKLSEVVTNKGLPLFYLTRQIPPDWAIKYLKRNKYSYMQFSINTSVKEDLEKLCPGAAPLNALLESIIELKKNNIYISIQINPIVAGVTSNEEIVKLIHMLAKSGVDHVIFKFAEIVTPAAKILVEKIKILFPEKGYIFEELFSETIGGLRTVKEEYRKNSLDLFLEETKKVGVTMGLCYEYEYIRNSENKIIDKTGISLGKKYCTADQCHGKRTPIHLKRKKENIFVPFEGCPTGGCLYCVEETNNIPPCKSEFLQEARALIPSDYKKSFWGQYDT